MHYSPLHYDFFPIHFQWMENGNVHKVVECVWSMSTRTQVLSLSHSGNFRYDEWPSTKSTTGNLILFSLNHVLNVFDVYTKKLSPVIQRLSLLPIVQNEGTEAAMMAGILSYDKSTIGGTKAPTAFPMISVVRLTNTDSIVNCFVSRSSEHFPACGIRKKAVSSVLKTWLGSFVISK